MANIIFWNSIFPLQKTRPIGCYQLAHHLRKNDMSARVIDFCGLFSSKELIEITEKFIDKETKALGISTSYWLDNTFPLKNQIAVFREKYPNIKIIFGGPRANNLLYKDSYDKILVGEAEDTLCAYLYELLNKDRSKIIPFDITKLDHRFIEEDCILPGEVLPIELGRGCIFKCKFCSHHNLGKPKYTYQRNYSLIYDEMKYNYEMFNTTHYLFLDDTVNEDLDKIKALAEINNKFEYKINWNGYLRADLIWSNTDSSQYLIDSGIKSCFFGIESFHAKASATIGKGWSGKHGKDFLPKLYNILWNKKISIWNNFIIGLPYETEKDIDDSVQWCKENTFGTNRFTGLNLYTNRSDSGTKSEFTRNYGLYGYKVKEDGSFYNNNWSSSTINLKVREIEKELFQFNKLSSWLLFDAYNVTRYPLDTLKDFNITYNCIKELMQFKIKYKLALEDSI